MNESGTFGEILRRYRGIAGLTQETLAERAKLSVRGVSDLERGVNLSPHAQTVQLLATALGLSEQQRTALEVAARRPTHATPSSNGLPTPAAATAAPMGSMTTPPRPLIGRLEERSLIESHLLGEGPPVLIFAGEPGIGKTRLLQAGAVQASSYALLMGGCQRRSGQEPYAPILAALQHYMQSRPPDQLRRDLHGCAWLVRLLPELAAEAIEPLPDWNLPPEQERRLMFAAASRFLANLTRSAPGLVGALLMLDDLQWAGSDALDLLAALARVAAESSLRVICAYRNTDVRPQDPLAVLLADLAHAGLVRHHTIASLNNHEAAQLLAQLVEAPHRESAEAQQALQRTGGVPFYLVSYAQELRLQGSRPHTPDDVPWNVAHSIRQRVAALPPLAQELLGVASVVGRIASRTLLGAVAARPDFNTLAALDAASQARLLVEEGPLAYQFAHDVIREVVEADLGAARRSVLHRLIASALEAQPGEPPVGDLAYHYAQSDQPEQALPYLTRAAERARLAAAYQEEEALLAQACELAQRIGRDDLLGDLHAHRGKALAHMTRMAEARQEMHIALTCLPLQQQARRVEILIDLAITSHWISDAASTRHYGSQALALAEEMAREDLEIAALSALVFADSSDGDLQNGLNRYRQAARRAGDHHLAAIAPGMEMASAMLYWLADFDNAITCAQDAVALSRMAHDTSTLARAQGDLGCALMGSGRYSEALTVFGQGQQESADLGATQWLARSTAMRGGLHLDLYDFDAAATLAEEARELSRSVQWMNALASAGIDLLLNFTRRGEIGRAEAVIEEVSDHVAKGQGTHGWLWRVRFALAQAELALARHELEQALHWADEAINRSRRHGRIKYEVAGLQVRGQALAAMGQQREALAPLHLAAKRARSTSDPAMFVRAAAALLAIDGDDALLAEARSAVERILTALPNAAMRQRFLKAAPAQLITRLART